MNRNLFKLRAELTLSVPEVIGLLRPQPQSRPIAAEPAQPCGHLGRDRHLLGHDPMKRLARYAKLPRRLANRETDRRKDVLAQDSAGMGRPSC